MGGLWGAGHNAGQIIFAIVFLLLRDRLPFNLEAIESGGKALVGATLLLIGMLVCTLAEVSNRLCCASARQPSTSVASAIV